MKRLLIYFFYDKDGIVDDYILYFLKSFRKYCQEICVVVNGNITEESKNDLKEITDFVLRKENKGFDSWAYKYALEFYGYEKLKEFDEVILANFTTFGPIYSVEDFFNKTNAFNCDFWGITLNSNENQKVLETSIEEHIQSYFLVFRKKILLSKDFMNYWINLKMPNNYEEAIAFFELSCTKYFKEKGYKYLSYVEHQKYKEKLKKLPYFYYTFKQVKEDKMPFIKRKIFSTKNKTLEHPIEYGIKELFKYLKNNTTYDTSLITKNIKRSFDYNLTLSDAIKSYFYLTFKQITSPFRFMKYQRKKSLIIETLLLNKK